MIVLAALWPFALCVCAPSNLDLGAVQVMVQLHPLRAPSSSQMIPCSSSSPTLSWTRLCLPLVMSLGTPRRESGKWRSTWEIVTDIGAKAIPEFWNWYVYKYLILRNINMFLQSNFCFLKQMLNHKQLYKNFAWIKYCKSYNLNNTNHKIK